MKQQDLQQLLAALRELGGTRPQVCVPLALEQGGVEGGSLRIDHADSQVVSCRSC